MTARLERHIHCGSDQPSGKVAADGVLEGRQLGVVLTRTGVKSLAQDAVAAD
jgi:hypothetical protein